MQAAKPSASKNSFLVIVSFVGMCLLYHTFASRQQLIRLFSRCLPYEYFRSQDGGGYRTKVYTFASGPTHTRPT